MIYIPLSKEPSLVERFGVVYRLYKPYVPRWTSR